MNLSKIFGDKKFMWLVLTVATPLMLQQLITGSVHLVDNLMVAQLGDAALGGVASTNRFYMIAQFGMFGMSTAATIFIAQYYGAKNVNRMKESFRFLIITSLGIAFFFLVAAQLFTKDILSFFTEDIATMQQGMEYLKVASWTFIPVALVLACAGSLRSIGETKIPLYISAMTVLLNTLLNYILIFGHFGFPALGVQGAGLATLMARLLEVALLLMVLVRGDYPFKTSVKDLFKVSKVMIRKISIKAAPLMANEVLWASGMTTLFMLYSKRGADVMVGYSIASTVADLFFVLFGGMATASAVLISQPLGANRLEEGRRNGYRLIGFSSLLAIVFGTVMFVTSYSIPLLYTNSSAMTLEFAGTMLRIQSVMFIFYMMSTQNYFILRAGGDTKSTFIFDSGFMWLINIPVVAVLIYYSDLSIYLVYLAGQMVEFLKLGVGFYFVRKEKWVHNLAKEEFDEDILVLDKV